MNWAIAGRNKTKLEALKSKLCRLNPGLSELRVITADSSDEQAVDDMIKQCRVVVSTAGPFRLYGTNVVRSCVRNGTDYCDITGEVDWVREMIDLYGAQANVTGSRIVFCCGADSVPWDLACWLLQNKLQSKNETLVRTDHFNEGRGRFSGGTLKSLLLKVDGHVTKDSQRLPFDPLLARYDHSGQLVKSATKTRAKLDRCIGKDPLIEGWTMMSLIAFGNSRVVSRSNAILDYKNGFVYREAMVSSHFVNAFNFYCGLALLGVVIMLRPLRWLCLKLKLLPSPGQGPDHESLKTYYLIIDSIGHGSGGSKVRLKTTYKKDIGYVDTARILVESGLCFIFAPDQCESSGGMHTPASCFGGSLKIRLENSGTGFDFA